MEVQRRAKRSGFVAGFLWHNRSLQQLIWRLISTPLVLRQILQAIQEVHCCLEDSPQVLPAKPLTPLSVAFRQRQRSADDIADLSPIQDVPPTQALHLHVQILARAMDLGIRTLCEKVFEDCKFLLLGEVFVLDGEVHARLHCDVERCDAVGR